MITKNKEGKLILEFESLNAIDLESVRCCLHDAIGNSVENLQANRKCETTFREVTDSVWFLNKLLKDFTIHDSVFKD